MTLGMGLYLLGISLSLVVAAAIGEWLLVRLYRPSRWVWAGALLLSVLLPLVPGIPLTIRRVAGTVAEPSTLAISDQSTISTEVDAPIIDAPPAWSLWTVSESLLLLLSLGVTSLLLLGWIVLVWRARRWQHARMDGTLVLVAPATGPAVIGFLQPRIVVPQWAFELPAEQRRMLLAHEQSHIAARDPLLLLLAGLMVIMAPWNPCIWYALRRLRGAIEIDCDQRVLAAGMPVSSYAQCLVDAATQAMNAQVMPVGSLALSSSFLERRIAIMRRSARLSALAAALGAFAVAGFVLLAGATRPPAPVAAPAIQALEGVRSAREEYITASERYYARLTSGKLAAPQALWNVFNTDFSIRDTRVRRTLTGEGC